MGVQKYIQPYEDNKPRSKYWHFRASETDKASFAKLKELLNVRTEAEAVRRAVKFMIEEIEKGT